jgi:hypothetical protein
MHEGVSTTVSIRVNGDQVLVEYGTYRRECHNVVVLGRNAKGAQKIIAVGEGRDALVLPDVPGRDQLAAQTLLAGAEDCVAVDVGDFWPKLAALFVGYLVAEPVLPRPWWSVRRVLDVRVEIAGYALIPEEQRLEFEEKLEGLGRKVSVNGAPIRSRPLPWWHWPVRVGALVLCIWSSSTIDGPLRVPVGLLGILAMSIPHRFSRSSSRPRRGERRP